MPTPRKVDQLPENIREWLKSRLKDRGFSGYEHIANELNDILESEGIELRLSHMAVHRFGTEYETFTKYQEQASAWAAEWINEEGLESEAKRHGVLFQMVTTLAFKFMKDRMSDEEEVDPKELHFIGRMLKDIMQSSGLREKLIEDERSAQAKRLDDAVQSGDIDAEAAARAREIMGFG